jgi:sporulation related protein
MARGGRGAPQSRRVRRDVRWFSAPILVTCVAVAGLGLASGLSLDRAPEAPSALARAAEDALPLAPLHIALTAAAAPDAIASASSPVLALALGERAAPQVELTSSDANLATEREPIPLSPAVAAEALPSTPAPDHVAALAAVEPQAGTSASEPTSAWRVAAAGAAAIPAPPRSKAAGGYWVEYAVFAHERSAARLRKALAAVDLKTSVVATHAPDGRRLWRVRSAMAERVGAEADARLAREKLGLKPLLHRAAHRREPRAQYWVQFGSFPTIAPAVQLQRVLADNGVKASVRSTRTSAGKPLFLVRSDGFPDRRLATLVGELGGSAANVAFFVGRSPPSRHAAGPHSGARGATGSSVPRHKQAPRPGG